MSSFSEVCKEDKLFTELALRLVGIGNDGIPFSFGTAFVLRPYLFVTAKHVVEEFISNSSPTEEEKTLELTFWAIQIEKKKEGHNYNIWQVVNAYLSPHSDLCLLHVGAYNDTASNYSSWKTLPVSLIPPNIGEEVNGFGFHATKFEGSTKSKDGKLEHLEINDTSSKSSGFVKEVFMHKRDSVMLPFPCFGVDCRFDGGMSGGLVLNSNSELCGVICSSISSDNEHYSYVAMIWPVLGIEVDFGEADPDVKGIHPLSKLIELGDWKPRGWDKVDVMYVENGDGRSLNVAYKL